MTGRQERVLSEMYARMSRRFMENEWREKMTFPSIQELVVRAHAAITKAYHETVAGSKELALSNAADAANLIGLVVLYDEVKGTNP